MSATDTRPLSCFARWGLLVAYVQSFEMLDGALYGFDEGACVHDAFALRFHGREAGQQATSVPSKARRWPIKPS